MNEEAFWFPHGSRIVLTCHGCGRQKIEDRELIVYPDMWRGDDLFYLATTGCIVTTWKVQQIVADLQATNVAPKPAGFASSPW